MGRVLVLCFALAVIAAYTLAYTPVKWTNLYVKWDLLSYLARVTGIGFFKMPLSTQEAKDANWVQAATAAHYTTWCMKDDPRMCMLYDMQDSIAGVQISLLTNDVMFKDNPYDVTKHPYFMKNNIFGKDVVSVRYFLVSQEMLEAGGRLRVKGDEIGSGIWLQKGNSFVNVPRNAEELTPDWTKEKCIFNMGRHYYYNISETMECNKFEPYFLLVNNKKNALHGIGFQTIGHSSILEKNWFETVPPFAVKHTLPNAPQCLEDWVTKYGIISVHVYFVDRPWFIVC